MRLEDVYAGLKGPNDPAFDIAIFREEHLRPRKVYTIDAVCLRWHVQVSVELE